MTEVRAAATYAARPVPARATERAAQSPELLPIRVLLQGLLSNPALGQELSGELLDQGSLEERALAAVAGFCRANPGTEGNIVVDHFQGSEFRGVLEASQATLLALLDKGLEGEHMEREFRDALGVMREKRRKQRFELLRIKRDRTPDEEAEMLRLLRERSLGTVSASIGAEISGSSPTS